MSIFTLTYNGKSFNQRETDNYVNLGQLCATHDKRFTHWISNQSSNAYLEALSANVGIPLSELVISKRGNEGTWGHPLVAEEVLKWCLKSVSNQQKEKEIQQKLALSKNAQTEVSTKAGFIDIVAQKEIIEVKNIKDWKHAVGQIIIYGLEYPKKKKRIHLFGKCSEDFKLMVVSYCDQLDISVSFE
jgi:hypothetical protein